ncbi:MAG: 50S ribosomal protein L9 [Verrucomicrobiota bacterium]|jgi:large subunit ribosomal protein L9
MPKTEVILTQNVVGLGAESDQVKVAAGFARNYLIPQGLAIPLTAANKRRLDALRQRRAEREAKELTSMTELSQTLSKVTLLVHAKTGEDGKMFGSVTAGTIADELKHQFDVALDKRKIHLPHPIKTLGEHDIELRLHHDLTTTLKVKVEGTTQTGQPVAAAAPAAPAKESGAKPAGEKAEGKREKPERKSRESAEKKK